MKWKWPLIIIGGLVIILIVVNFILPKLPVPNLNKEEPQETIRSQSVLLNEVVLTEDGFKPKSLTIQHGEAVSFKNMSGEPATINSNPHPSHTFHPILNLGEFGDGAAFQVIFNDPGTYNYHNHYSPEQQGTIVVE